eukprot:85295-Rhodomonas_salina.1
MTTTTTTTRITTTGKKEKKRVAPADVGEGEVHAAQEEGVEALGDLAARRTASAVMHRFSCDAPLQL